MVRFAELVNPRQFVLENVRGIVHDRSGVFQTVRSEFERLGLQDSATAPGSGSAWCASAPATDVPCGDSGVGCRPGGCPVSPDDRSSFVRMRVFGHGVAGRNVRRSIRLVTQALWLSINRYEGVAPRFRPRRSRGYHRHRASPTVQCNLP